MTSLHASLLRSLELTVNPADPNPRVPDAPEPDTGVEKPSTVDDFSDRSGSLADKLARIEKEGTNAPTPTPPADPTPTPEAVTPTGDAPVTPTPTPNPETPEPAVAELPKIKVPELPRPMSDDIVLPPPPSTLDVSGLDEDEVEEVRTAEFAEQRYPQRYPGHAKRVLEYIRKHKQFVKTQEQENPDVSFDQSNTAYQRFLEANRPTITSSERKRLERERLLEEAASIAERRLAGKTKKLEEEVTQLKATPLVERTINDFKSLVKEIMPKEDDPIVLEKAEEMTGLAVTAGKEYLLLSSQLKQFDTKNETHKWLADFIKEQGELYVQSKHESLRRGGKSFLPRHQFNNLPADERAKHFSFSDEDVLQLIAVNAKAAAEFHAKTERDRLKRAGYTRTPSATAPTSPTPPVPPPLEPSARATPTVTGGGPIGDGQPTDPFLRFMRGR